MPNFFLLFFIYLIIILITLKLSKLLSLYDIPNYRKIHKSSVVNTGGISLYVFLIFIISNYEYSYDIELIISYGFIVVLCGLLDDRISLHPSFKLIFIIIPSLLLINEGYFITNLGIYEYIGIIELGKFSFIFNILAIGLLINSYNYIDGLDGLLLSLYIASLVYILFLVDNENVKNIILIIIIPLSLNLIFNLMPQKTNMKIFLGDSGSLFIGFFLSFLMIYLYKFENIHPSYLIWACWYAVYDFLYVTIKRIINKKKFYFADKSHLHHDILKKTKNDHLLAVLSINLMNIIVIVVGYQVTQNLGNLYSLLLFALLYVVFTFIRNNSKKLLNL